jgi:hypothetical protein
MLIALSLVDVSAVADLDDKDCEFAVTYLIDDPVVTDTDA